ncbi:MAG: HDOD domain-containing protein [Marinobacter sp.]|uniref:HDOD domain-containing protein n=1 Tax=Marinobacter sp. TaxID=50741 RepID=UPI0034A0479D
MELPVSVRQLLEETVPGWALRESSDDVSDVLRTVLLGDDQGQVQVIFRHQDLFDISTFNEQLGRDFHIVPLKHQMRVCERLGVKTVPALPTLTGLPCYIDKTVDSSSAVCVYVDGHSSERLLLDGKAFGLLTVDSDRVAAAVPVTGIGVNLNRPEDDQAQLQSALKRFTGLRIQQRLDDTLELPPLPETAQRIIHLRVNPNAVMGDLVDVVESDPSLAAQVVSWASSSFYASAAEVRSVHDAVSRILGFDLVMNLAMGLALGRALKQPSDQPAGYLGYWQQAIWQAQSAGTLASMMRRGERPAYGLAYLAGLLHNFGYLVLAQVFPPHFKLACRSWEVNPHLDTAIVEHHLLGVTREQIGAQLMSNWGMPDEINTAIRHQKDLDYAGTHSVYPKLLWLGRQLLTARGIPVGVGESVPDSVFDQLGLNRKMVEEQFDELVQNKASIMAMAGMMQS